MKTFGENNRVYIKSTNNDIYFEKNNVILDKTCPSCKKLLFKEKDFCECGFFLKSFNNSVFWGKFLFAWLIIGFLIVFALINVDNMKHNPVKNNHSIDFNSLSPVNIQIISALKNSPYDDYIQSVYVRDDNKLFVLVRPTLWNILTKKEKIDMLQLIDKSWKSVYKQNFPDQKKPSEVFFSNPE